jgi:glycosyltransferase involved in cell wall biosynthesis
MSSLGAALEALNYERLPVMHLFYQYHTIGGVESILKLHHELDSRIGVESDLVIYREGVEQSEDRVHCIGIRTNEPVRNFGRKLRSVTETKSGRIAIYHLPWGFNYLCPHDCANRRILLIHGKLSGSEGFLRKNTHFFDGVMCVNKQILEDFQAIAPGYPRERVIEVSSPIRPLAGVRSSEGISKPMQVGYVGRLMVQHKRIDRLPTFYSELGKSGWDFEMIAIGDGPDRQMIANEAAETRITGILEGSAYWDEVRKLDAIVFFSDTEGTPLSLLEALSQGVIPIYPKIQSGGDSYVEEVSRQLLYTAGNVEEAARIAASLASKPTEEIAQLRQRCRRAVEKHTVPGYLKGCFDFARKIQQMPRVSTSGVGTGLGMQLFKFLSLEQIDALIGIKRKIIG